MLLLKAYLPFPPAGIAHWDHGKSGHMKHSWSRWQVSHKKIWRKEKSLTFVRCLTVHIFNKHSPGGDRPNQCFFIIKDRGNVQLHLEFRKHWKHTWIHWYIDSFLYKIYIILCKWCLTIVFNTKLSLLHSFLYVRKRERCVEFKWYSD